MAELRQGVQWFIEYNKTRPDPVGPTPSVRLQHAGRLLLRSKGIPTGQAEFCYLMNKGTASCGRVVRAHER